MRTAVDILFIQNQSVVYFGIQALSSFLKSKGLKSALLVNTLEKDILRSISEYDTSLIGITVMSMEIKWLNDLTEKIKKVYPDKTIIIGGIHGIVYSKQALVESKYIDYVCNSEGENFLFEFVTKYKSKDDLGSIKGLVYRDKNGDVVENARAMLTQYDDRIVEEKNIYFERYPVMCAEGMHRFISSRGCPFDCSFCYNAVIKDIFRGEGNYVRRKSADNFIREIELETNNRNVSSVYFFDDLFTFDKKWLEEFLSEYKNRINIPFSCTTRADLINENTVKLLAESGCITCSYGIESGNEKVRTGLLKKNVTNKQIIDCGRLLRKYNINSLTSNMFCLPDDDLNIAMEGVALNIEARTKLVLSSIYLPFPDTELAKYCIKKGYLKEDYSFRDMQKSFFKETSLVLKDSDKMINVQRLIAVFVRFPLFFRFAKNIVHIKFTKSIFYIIFLLSNFARYMEANKTPFFKSIVYAWRMRKSL